MLTGEILILRPLVAEDYDGLYKVASDPLIWDMHPFPRYEKPAFSEFFEAAVGTKSGFAILDKATQQIIGTSRYYNISEDQVYIGYTFLARSHWGGVFNRELKTLMIGHALKFVKEVFFDIGEYNLRSRRAIEKIGAQFVKLQDLKGKPYSLYRIDEQGLHKSLALN